MKISENQQAYIYAAVAATAMVGIGLSPLGTRLAQSILAKLPSSLSSSLNSQLVGRATTLFTAGIISYAAYAVLRPEKQPDNTNNAQIENYAACAVLRPEKQPDNTNNAQIENKINDKKNTDRPGVLLSANTKAELMFNETLNLYLVELTPGATPSWESPQGWTLGEPLPRKSYDALNTVFGNSLPENRLEQ